MQRQETIRQFLVWNLDGKLDRISVFDNDQDAINAYNAAEIDLKPGERCVLLGADRLATLLAIHGNWFDEPSKLDQILDESSFGPKSRPDPRKEEDTMDGDRISAHYDVEADALHIALTQVSRVDSTIEAAPCVMLDKKGGEVVGIEVLYPRQPLQLAKVAAEHGFAEHLDAIYGVAASVLGVSCSSDVKLTTVEAWAAR